MLVLFSGPTPSSSPLPSRRPPSGSYQCSRLPVITEFFLPPLLARRSNFGFCKSLKEILDSTWIKTSRILKKLIPFFFYLSYGLWTYYLMNELNSTDINANPALLPSLLAFYEELTSLHPLDAVRTFVAPFSWTTKLRQQGLSQQFYSVY